MVEQRIATRYAKSLVDLGVEIDCLDELQRDILSLKEALTNRDLYLLTKSPIIKPDKKISIFKEVFGSSFNKVTMAFFDIITRKGREVILPEMTTAFLEQYQKLKKVTSVKLTTAAVVSEDSLERIKKVLLASEVTDEKVEIEADIDEQLIGGFVLKMGDKLYDASVAYKLDQIKKIFTDNKYIKSN